MACLVLILFVAFSSISAGALVLFLKLPSAGLSWVPSAPARILVLAADHPNLRLDGEQWHSHYGA